MTQALPAVQILMATYNGERFLPAQLESLMKQDWPGGVRLVVRDDASSDRTPELLKRAAISNQRIRLLEDDGGRLGYRDNFGTLLDWAAADGAELIALSDQDDLWDSQKLSCLAAQLATVSGADAALPALAFSDWQLIDAQGHQIDRAAGEPADALQLGRLVVENRVPGCMAMFNRELLQLATPIPACIRNHDHWLVLCAAAYGRLLRDSRVLVSYRQHGGNAIGESRMAPRRFFRNRCRDWRMLPELLGELIRRGEVHQRPVPSALLGWREVVERRGGFAGCLSLARQGLRPHSRIHQLMWLWASLLEGRD